MASLWRPPKQPGDFDLEVDRRDWDTGDAEPPPCSAAFTAGAGLPPAPADLPLAES